MLIAVVSALAIVGLLGTFAVSTAATTEPLTGSVYVEGVVGSSQQLNPLLQTAATSPAERDIAALVFEGLTRIDGEGRAQPVLAERWEASDDARIFTFTLRSDRTWHDGAPVTAADVLYTLRGIQNAGFPGDPALRSFWNTVLIDQIDDLTIRFELPAPLASFPSVARVPILPAHLLRTLQPAQWPSADLSRRPIGSGRWRMAAISDEQVLFVPFADHPDRPAVDNLLLRLYPTADAAVLALSRNEVQGVATLPTAGRRAPAPPRRTQRMSDPLGDYTIVTFNLEQPPLDAPQFRQALAQSVNRDLLIASALGGQAQALETPILPGTWAFDPAARLPEFRRSAAQQAFGVLGYVDRDGDGLLELEGEPLRLPLLCADTPESIAVANELRRQLREVGVDLVIDAVPADMLQRALRSRSFTLALHSWSEVGVDPDVFALWHSSEAAGGANYAGLRDQQIDQLLVDGRATTGEAQRRTIYSEFQQRWAALLPSLPLYQPVLAYDVAQTIRVPRADNFLPNRSQRFALLNGWEVPAP